MGQTAYSIAVPSTPSAESDPLRHPLRTVRRHDVRTLDRPLWKNGRRHLNKVRVLLVSSIVAVAFGHPVAGADAATGPLVKNVNGWITALAMDGSQVVYATQAFAPTNCFKLFTWNVTTRAGVLVSGPSSGRCSSDEPHGQRIREVAIAGTRVAWIRNITGNTESDDYLFTATLPKPREVQLAAARRTGDTSGGPLKGGWIGGLVGSAAVLAADTWTTGAGGAVTRAALRRVGPTRLGTIATGRSTLTAESADTGRIAVARSDGSVAVYSASGPLLRTITPSSTREIALRKDYLIVLTRTKSLEIYNSHTGVFIRKWPVPAGAGNLDVNANIAVYSVWRKLYGLQLTTGKHVVLAAQKRAVVAAEIEAPGVLYAYNTVRATTEIGNLVFLPLTGVSAALSH